jgi:hypothetical protein
MSGESAEVAKRAKRGQADSVLLRKGNRRLAGTQPQELYHQALRHDLPAISVRGQLVSMQPVGNESRVDPKPPMT